MLKEEGKSHRNTLQLHYESITRTYALKVANLYILSLELEVYDEREWEHGPYGLGHGPKGTRCEHGHYPMGNGLQNPKSALQASLASRER